MSANHKPKFKKGQIKTMGADQCSDELRALNLDPNGGLGVKRERLRAALYPDPNASTLVQTQNVSQPTASVNIEDENTTQWLLIKKTSGPVYTRGAEKNPVEFLPKWLTRLFPKMTKKLGSYYSILQDVA